MPYTTLVSPAVLRTHLDDPGWVVCDCRYTLTDPEAGRRAYREAHIPGARYVHLEEDLSAPAGPGTGRHPLPNPADLAEKLGGWGIGAGVQVVAYDDTFGAMAARLWWLLRWLGHREVALLDGGWPRWQREGGPVTDRIPHPNPRVFPARPDDRLWVDAETAGRAAQDPGALLLDARAEERFTGEREPLDPVAGHVPGARNRPYEDNLAVSGDFLPARELAAEYQELLAGRAPAAVVHMCGSGVTACHNILAMEIAGLAGSRLYAGSWSEWITDPRRPVATGAEGDTPPHSSLHGQEA